MTVFISDLHLDPRRPAITALFLDFLTGLASGESLFILGDLFEAWIGDDEDDPHYQHILQHLRSTTERGVAIAVMHGNRDFLLGEGFARATGCALLKDPTRIELAGEPVLLMHGDTLCIDDQEYQQFRALVRNPDWQAEFLAKPLLERRQIAAHLRETSRQRTGEKDMNIMDVNSRAVADAMQAHGVRRLIHGHTHRPAIHDFDLDGHSVQRIVLGDWYEQGSVLTCVGGQYRLSTLPLS